MMIIQGSACPLPRSQPALSPIGTSLSSKTLTFCPPHRGEPCHPHLSKKQLLPRIAQAETPTSLVCHFPPTVTSICQQAMPTTPSKHIPVCTLPPSRAVPTTNTLWDSCSGLAASLPASTWMFLCYFSTQQPE